MKSSPTRAEFDSLNTGNLPGVDTEAEQGSHDVPSIVTAGAGVHVQRTERGVAHHFQNVRVAADE